MSCIFLLLKTLQPLWLCILHLELPTSGQQANPSTSARIDISPIHGIQKKREAREKRERSEREAREKGQLRAGGSEGLGISMDWKDWARKNVGPEDTHRLKGIAVADRRQEQDQYQYQQHTRSRSRWGWEQFGIHIRSSELAELCESLEACVLHKSVFKVADVPYLVTHVGEDEYIARSLLTAGITRNKEKKDKGETQGLVIRTNKTHAVVALYSFLEDAKAATIVHKFVATYLNNVDNNNYNNNVEWT